MRCYTKFFYFIQRKVQFHKTSWKNQDNTLMQFYCGIKGTKYLSLDFLEISQKSLLKSFVASLICKSRLGAHPLNFSFVYQFFSANSLGVTDESYENSMIIIMILRLCCSPKQFWNHVLYAGIRMLQWSKRLCDMEKK